MLIYFDDCVEVPAFEVALEKKFSLWLDCWVHAFEDSDLFRFEIRVKFAEKGSHVLIVPCQTTLILEHVISLQLLVHFEAALESVTYF